MAAIAILLLLAAPAATARRPSHADMGPSLPAKIPLPQPHADHDITPDARVRCDTAAPPPPTPPDSGTMTTEPRRSHPASPLIGPGHQSVLAAPGGDLLFFHAWNRDPDGRELPGVHKRCLYMSTLEWSAKGPVVAGGRPSP